MPPRLRAIFAEPLLHFLAVGLILYGIDRWRSDDPRGGPAPAPRERAARRVVVDAEVVGRLRDGFTRSRGRPPTGAELDEAVARWVDDEVLYREGLERGLDVDDPKVRERVASKMAYVIEQQLAVPEPTDAEVRAWFEAHRETWAEPERVDFTHVFVAGDDPEAERRAAALLAELQAGADPDRLGDRFSGGRRYRGRKPADLAESFGEAFAAGLAEQPPGTWALRRSRHGLHLVRVDRRAPARPAELAAVELDVRKSWKDAKKAEALAAALAGLRARWEIVRP